VLLGLRRKDGSQVSVKLTRGKRATFRDEANPDGDIAIEYTGLRPGEKLYEELLVTPDDQPTCHPLIRQAREPAPERADLQGVVGLLLKAAAGDDNTVALELLNILVPDFRPAHPKSTRTT